MLLRTRSRMPVIELTKEKPMPKKPAKKAKVSKPAKPAKKSKSKKVKKEAPPVEPEPEQLMYKGRSVKILRPATKQDSYYMEGQNQLIVEFADGSHATAFRGEITSV